MATNKLIKPTNVTVSIPAFTDQPDQRVNSNCIDKSIDGINALSDQIGNIIKSANYTLPASITINGNDSVTFGFSDFDIPTSSWILGGIVNSYNDANANALIITTSAWYSSGYITLVNARSTAVTLSQGRVITVYYA